MAYKKYGPMIKAHWSQDEGQLVLFTWDCFFFLLFCCLFFVSQVEIQWDNPRMSFFLFFFYFFSHPPPFPLPPSSFIVINTPTESGFGYQKLIKGPTRLKFGIWCLSYRALLTTCGCDKVSFGHSHMYRKLFWLPKATWRTNKAVIWVASIMFHADIGRATQVICC